MEQYRRRLVIIIVLVVAAGWLGMSLAVKSVEAELKNKLLLRAATASAIVSHERIEHLAAAAADKGSPDYEYLRGQLMAARSLNPDCRFVYLLKQVDGRTVFLMDSEPETSPDYSAPGSDYPEASDDLRNIFSQGNSLVEGPLSDEWGIWVSGLAAVRHPADGRIIAVLGMDIDARDWQAEIAHVRLIALSITLAVLAIVFAFYYAFRAAASAAEKVYLAEKQAKEAVEAVSQAKSQFLAYISHEIRTPVNGILGLGEMLETTGLGKRQQDYVSAIDYSARSLLLLLNDILDFSKLEAQKMTIENTPFAIRPVLHGVDSMLQAAAAAKGIKLTSSIDEQIPPQIMGDPVRLQQVLVNLISNAIKFTEVGQIEVKAVCLKRETAAAQLKFIITDTGIGLSPNEVSRLFQPFAQAEGANSRKYLGTGLGLSISAGLVALMGGEIGVESQKGVGSLFWFTIAVGVAETPPEAGAGSVPGVHRLVNALPPGWLSQPSITHSQLAGDILIVEDNLVNQQVISAQVRQAGLTADVAANGREAVDMAARSTYKLILMDCGLPLLDGLSAARLIRQQEQAAGSYTPIVALTGNSLPEEQQQCQEAGMDACLVKPVSGEKLKEVIERWLCVPCTERIDLAVLGELKQLADYGQTDVNQFIDAFLEELPMLVNKLKQALLTGEAEQLKAAAHSLKSMSATIGAKRLSRLFACMEQQAGQDNNDSKVRILMTQIGIECKQVEGALKNAVSAMIK